MELLSHKLISILNEGSMPRAKRQENAYNFITKNRLGAYFYHTKRNNVLQSLKGEVYNKLKIEIFATKMYVDKQINELSKINAASEATVLPIKGFVSYLLTNNKQLLKLSGDIDVISPNCESTNNYLLFNGYKCVDSGLSAHEYSVLKNEDNMMVELQEYFPIVSIDRTKNKLETAKLTYEDIYRHSLTLDYNGSNITIPGYETSTLIACSHAFKDFAWEPYVLPNFRFIDIIEAYSLSMHNKFDMEIFKQLIKKYNAYDAVSFCSSIIDVFFDENPFKCLDLNFPRMFKIMNATHGQWVKSKNKDFFYHLPTRTFRDIFKDLGSNKIEYGKRYKSNSMDIMHVNCTSKKPEVFEFKIERHTSTLIVTLQVFRLLSKNDNFFFHTGMAFGHLWIDKKNRFYSKGDVTYKLNEDAQLSVVKFYVNLKTVNEILDFVIAIGDQTKDDVSQLLIPLSVLTNNLEN